jgi:hypothetical protein
VHTLVSSGKEDSKLNESTSASQGRGEIESNLETKSVFHTTRHNTLSFTDKANNDEERGIFYSTYARLTSCSAYITFLGKSLAVY